MCLGAGTLYGALNTMERKGWIEPLGDDGGRKKEYKITPLGREMAERELRGLRELVRTAEEIMGGKKP